jgi:type 1 fimbria pilin
MLKLTHKTTLPIIIGAAILLTSGHVLAYCTTSGSDIPVLPAIKINVPSSMAYGEVIGVWQRSGSKTVAVTCTEASDAVKVYANGSWTGDYYATGVPGIAFKIALAISGKTYSVGDVLFSGKGQFSFAPINYTVTLVKTGPVEPGKFSFLAFGGLGYPSREGSMRVVGRLDHSGITATSSTCMVNNASQSVRVNANAQELDKVGEYGKKTNFSISLSNCPVGITKVTAQMNGAADVGNGDASVFANTNGTARGVGIEIGTAEGAVVTPNARAAVSWSVDDSTIARNYGFYARLKRTGVLTTGSVNSTVQVLFNYE